MTMRSSAVTAHDEPLAYEAVYAELRRELLADEILPGARLREVDLADRLSVSRTPVREALRRLESDGFVQRSASGRLVATPAGPDDLGDIGLLRIEIDGLAARLASARGSEADWDARARAGRGAASRARRGRARRTPTGICTAPSTRSASVRGWRRSSAPTSCRTSRGP